MFRILDIIRLIPHGKVSTYGRVAAAAGLAGSARLVGRVLRDSPLAESVPWHRVIGASGRISVRPGGGPDEQRRRLLSEGVTVSRTGRVELRGILWMPQGGKGVRAGRSATQ